MPHDPLKLVVDLSLRVWQSVSWVQSLPTSSSCRNRCWNLSWSPPISWSRTTVDLSSMDPDAVSVCYFNKKSKKEYAKNRSKWICVSTHTWYLASSKSALPVDLASLANWMPLEESLLLVLVLSVKSGRERHLLAVDETRLSLDDCWVCKFSTLEVCPDFDKAAAEKAKWQTLWHRRSLGLPLIRGEADLDFRKLRLLKPLPRQHTKGLHKREINDFWTFLDRKM